MCRFILRMAIPCYPCVPYEGGVGREKPNGLEYEDKAATVAFGGNLIRFSIKENTIAKNGKDLPVWGKMEVKDGRVFVPLRNWSGILQSIGYLMEEGDITWDSTTRLATVCAVEQKLDPSNGLEKPALSGKGAQASYTMALTTQYDEIEPLGDGYFLAQKYTEKRMSAWVSAWADAKMYGIFWIVGKGVAVLWTPERITIWRTAASEPS